MSFKHINYRHLPFLLVVFLLFYSNFKAQTVFVAENNEIYEYLDKLYIKGIIDYNDVIKPLSRKYIAEKLNEASKSISQMSEIEKEDLAFYKKEYYLELQLINKDKLYPKLDYLSFGQQQRFRFFSYSDSVLSINADPILGYDIIKRSGNKLLYRKNGAESFGSVKNFLGFNINFKDNLEDGKFIDTSRTFSEKTGFSFKNNNITNINFDDVCADLTYSWSWGYLSLAKDYMRWGSGNNGQIILSDKAPSFPMVRLNFSPIEWLDFTYIHGYLNSEVIDSSTIRLNTSRERKHYEFIEKYFVAHMLTIKPLSGITLSLGESVVYSDRIEPIYFIPIIPFRLADHYLTYRDEAAGNAQVFFDINYIVPKINSKFYGTLFIDEFSMTNVIDNTKYPSALAYTIGYMVNDPFIKDISLNLEYTRINPFVYFHVDDAQGYSNYGYQMGHWIGSNGDQIYLSMTKSFMRGLKLNAYWEYIRKGQKESHNEKRYQSWQTFLYGLRTNYTYFGIGLHYEIIHTLFAKLDYKYSKIESQQKDLLYKTEKYNDFTIGLSYGL